MERTAEQEKEHADVLQLIVLRWCDEIDDWDTGLDSEPAFEEKHVYEICTWPWNYYGRRVSECALFTDQDVTDVRNALRVHMDQTITPPHFFSFEVDLDESRDTMNLRIYNIWDPAAPA